MTRTSLVLTDYPAPGLAVVTLNRPDAMNALSVQLRQELHDAFRKLEADRVRVAILTGSGKAFCAGLDLKELGQDTSSLGGRVGDDPVGAMGAFSGVTIGAINGGAITGGFELALACDLLVASDKAFFIDTHALVGVIPGWGLSQMLSRVIGPYRARQASLTAQRITAEMADKWGLVGEVVPSNALMERAQEVAAQVLATPEDMQRNYKKLINDGYDVSYADARQLETRTARQSNTSVDASKVEERRLSIQARNRTS